MTLTPLIFPFRLPLIGLCLLVVSGCTLLPAPSSDPTRYYVLSGASLDQTRPTKAEHARVIGLKRIEITPYLNGKDLVVREAGNEITYHSFSRWAEPLATSIGRVLADRLEASANVARVYAQPFPFEVARDYDLAVSVVRCEGERRADGRAVPSLVAVIELTEAKAGGAVVHRKTFIAPAQSWDGKDFGALAAALSEGVAALGVELTQLIPAP